MKLDTYLIKTDTLGNIIWYTPFRFSVYDYVNNKLIRIINGDNPMIDVQFEKALLVEIRINE